MLLRLRSGRALRPSSGRLHRLRLLPLAAGCVLAASLLAQVGSPSVPREAAYRHNNIGVAYLEQYNFEAAAASFRSALEQDATLALARLNLGIALFYGGQPEAAATELERARDVLSGRPGPDYVLGLIARAANRPDDALAAFTRAQKIDPTDAGIAINIGQLHLQQRRYAEALASFRVAETAEPYNATAEYGLATALIRSGAAEEGKAAMARFEKLRASNYATTFSTAYLEQGRYAEAIASTGAEPGLVDEQVPNVVFADATAAIAPDAAALPPTAGPLALFDLDGDGDLDLADGGAGALRLYRNDSGRFADISASALAARFAANGIVAGDSDNDGDPDLLLFATGPAQLLRQEPGPRFVAAANAGLPQMHSVRSAAWLDADHDGDLDLILTGLNPQKTPAAYLLQNDGMGRFTDVTTAAAIKIAGAMVAAVPTDFDNRRDVDIFMVPGQGAPALLRNLRDGTFRDVASDVGVALDGRYSSIAAGDINKDNYPDFFLGDSDSAGRVLISDGRGRFSASAGPAATARALASQFLDYDNDGLLDLLVLTADGSRLLRSLGGRWEDVSAKAFATPWPARGGNVGAIASGDVDGDGDVDVMMRTAAGLKIFRNDGGSRARSLRVHLTSRVSNRSAIGTKIEVRAGSLRQRLESYATSAAPAPADIVFGLGTRTGADVARVQWPSGILQAETAAGDGAATGAGLSGTLKIEELDRKPSSCPYLFTWNGSRFEFVTDFLGGGEMGYWEAPGLRNTPDPDEYVRIDGRQLQPRNGRYELRVTNELEEVVYLDRVELLAIAHPATVEVHPNEGLRSSPKPFVLHRLRDLQPPAAVVDEHGHDVRDRVMSVDRRYPDDFALEPIRGYAAEHSLTITLPAGPAGRALLLTGWTDYAFSGDNVAAHQRGLRMTPPALQVERDGGWTPAIDEIGFPVGRPQTVVVDLSTLGAARRVRITTSMRIYWDRIQIATIDETTAVTTTRLPATAADLRWRGFSAVNDRDGRLDYDHVSPLSPWKLLTGRYTREGDVRELVTASDDRFVIGRSGDELALSFDASRLPPLPEGWTRTFLLFADGFSKEMDLNSASPDRVEPLPFHGMPQYPYAPSDVPAWSQSPAYLDYVARYNTRVVKRNIPPLELSAR